MTLDRRQFLTAGAAAFAYAGMNVLFNAADRVAFAEDNAANDPAGEIGKPYAGWKEGDFEIHFIYTGASENTFHIFPDGTTALVDCGDFDVVGTRGRRACALKPDASKRPGEWVARYISRLRPELTTIDYVIASHFHSDHIGGGDVGGGITCGRDPDYQLSGIPHVGEFYHFGKAFDRGYPNYNRPTSWAPEERENLLKFFVHAEKEYGLKRERFEVGALDQIQAQNAPEKYDFHVRNICCGGVVWQGEGQPNFDAFETYPSNKKTNKNENTRSLATVWEYGPFRYYTGGDVSGVLVDDNGVDIDYEGMVGRVVGPVDVCKTNHHSFEDAMRPTFVNAVQARAYVTCVWCEGHLRANTAAAMSDDSATGYPGERVICPNGWHEDWDGAMEGQTWRDNVVKGCGHVVVKAYDGGTKYKIYYLTCEDESMRVDRVFGPFTPKRA